MDNILNCKEKDVASVLFCLDINNLKFKQEKALSPLSESKNFNTIHSQFASTLIFFNITFSSEMYSSVLILNYLKDVDLFTL
jgi:hypothetical protein